MKHNLKLLIVLLMGLMAFDAAAETFLIRGNKTPILLELTQFEERNGTVTFQDDLTLDLPYKSLELFNVEGRLWDFDEETGLYDSAELIVSFGDFLTQLYGEGAIITMDNRAQAIVTLTEGNDLVTRIPLDSKKRYLQIQAIGGRYLGIGQLNFEIAILQAEQEIGLGLEEPTLFLTAALSGLGAFLSPIQMAGLGISTKKVFKFEPKTTFGFNEDIKKAMRFNGQLAIVGSAGIPKIPVSLTGELVTQFDGPLIEKRKQGFNGNLGSSYKFSGEFGLSLELGNASAYMVRPTLMGERGDVEMTFSGVQDPKVPLLPSDFPIKSGKEIKIAGRMSSKLDRSFFVAHMDYTVLNIPLSQGRLNIDKNGVLASGFWSTPVSRIGLTGEVSKRKIALTGSAQARLDVNGVLEKTEWVTNAAICGTRYATSGAKCGYKFLSGKVQCLASKIPHGICMKRCKKAPVRPGLPTPQARFTCEQQCFLQVGVHCKKAKKCSFPNSCERVVRIPNSNLGHISADVALLLSTAGIGGEVTAEFCPLKKKCAKLPAGKVRLDVSDIKKPKVCIGKGVAGSSKGLCVGI